MGYDPSTAPQLKPWLVKTLEPICDAEPGALADYVLALLKHDAPENEMRKELLVQLEEFLEKETKSFIDTLLTAIRTKSYVPYETSPPPLPTAANASTAGDTGIPIPLDALMTPSTDIPTSPRGRKRGLEHDDHDRRAPAKGPRLSVDGQFSRHQNGNGTNQTYTNGSVYTSRDNPSNSWNGRNNGGFRGGMHGGMNGHGMGMGLMNGMGMFGLPGMNGGFYPPSGEKRPICRDYHNNGYCARGVMCKYSHGEDAIIPGQMFPFPAMGIPPFLPMLPQGPSAAYDPTEAHMDMGRGPSGQSANDMSVVTDLTPQGPDSSSAQPSGMDVDSYGPTNGSEQQQQQQQQHRRGGGPHRGRGRGGRGGTFGGSADPVRPSQKRSDLTLVVEKIPPEALSREAIIEWFKRFGTVTEVAVDPSQAKALVSFADHDTARKAWQSPESIFNNRFVKVFWHRPLEGHGGAGAKMLKASAPLVKNLVAKDSTAAPGMSTDAPSVSAGALPPAKKVGSTSAAAALAAKQKLLEDQIAEQKSLMTQLATASAEEKKTIMARLRKLGEEMKSASVSTASTSAAPSTPSLVNKQKREMDMLDKELEIHAAEGGDPAGEETTEDLKAKLARLKAEAASLGLPEAGEDTSASAGTYASTSTYRPYRGRGRGVPRGAYNTYRGAFRGGAAPRSSMKLDNRPRKLVIKGVNAEGVQAVKDWYESHGIESVETFDSGDVVVAFKTRAGAEQGLAKGSHIPTVGPVRVSFQTLQTASMATKTDPPPPIVTQDTKMVDDSTTSPAREPSLPRDEEANGGWGADDDGMGMF